MDRAIGRLGAQENPFPKVLVSFLTAFQSIGQAFARFRDLFISDFRGGFQERSGVFGECACIMAQRVGSFEMARSILSLHKVSLVPE